MQHFRRITIGLVLGGLLAFAMTAAPAPAQAAGTTLYVDDTPANNGSVSCPASTPPTYPSLQTAKAVADLVPGRANVTIIVCPGVYLAASNEVTFTGYKNLKITGKGGPTFNADGYDGFLLQVTDSTRVTVSGLIMNGYGNLGSGLTAAITLINSTGTIKGNLVTQWHENFGAPLTANITGIIVGTSTPAQKVVVDRNTVLDAQLYGILSNGPGKVQISHNKVIYHGDVTIPDFWGSGQFLQAGIFVYLAGTGTKVTGNVVESNAGLEPKPCASCIPVEQPSRGILVMQSTGVQVKSNTVSFMQYGITVENWCYASSTDTLANSNLISGNKLYDNFFGVYILAQNYFGTGCVPHSDFNKVMSNKVTLDMDGGPAVRIKAQLPATSAGNVVKKNTFTGYYTLDQAIGVLGSDTGVTGLVKTPNKLVGMPATGAAPQPAAADLPELTPPVMIELP